MRLLFVNACTRGAGISRTLNLCCAFLEEARASEPTLEIVEHDLSAMRLQPIDAETLARKEALSEGLDWSSELFSPVLEFAQADAVLVGAPYWDLSFPSTLKIWVEHMYVRNLTFRYTSDGLPEGLAKGKAAYYITTAGSPIGENDWGAGYMRAVLKTLGIPRFEAFRADGIDIDGRDKDAILRRAEEKVRVAGSMLGRRLE